MLILTRRAGEALVIDNKIKVVILSVKAGQVRIGIEAPKDISVHREEVYKRIQSEEKSEKEK